MELNITSEEQLLRYLKEHLTSEIVTEAQYYGDTDITFNVKLNGQTILSDSTWIHGSDSYYEDEQY